MAAEEGALHVLVELRTEEEDDCDDEDDAPLPSNNVSKCKR
jgi:hypothetical protein